MGNYDWKMAVFRWEAYSGMIGSIGASAHQQAKIDRERYGAEYYELGAGRNIVNNPYRLLRFTTEVCGLTYAESLGHLAEITDETLPFHGGDEPTYLVAKEMLAGTGNVLECIWLARFYSRMATRRGSFDAAVGWTNLIPIFAKCRMKTVATRL